MLLPAAREISIPLLSLSTKVDPIADFVFPPPKIPWQLTGNHWVAIPCIHPADGSIHAIGTLHRGVRGAVELAGDANFGHGLEGGGEPLLRLGITVDGLPVDLGAARMAWQRMSEWLPTFTATLGDLVVRGTIFAPHGRGAEAPGFVYAVSFENRGLRSVEVDFAPQGTLALRQHRIVTARPFDDAKVGVVRDDVILLTGAAPLTAVSLVLAGEGGAPAVQSLPDGSIRWSLNQRLVVPAGERVETAVYGAVGSERDGAEATLQLLRRRGWRPLMETTQGALSKLEQSTGNLSADRLVNRHMMFAYFYSVARAVDDAQVYIVRTRVPWNSHGVTVRDWDALMWTIPAVQIGDQELARELILRMCEVHGYAPGRGVNYFDGAPFCPAFSLDGVAAYPIAVDRYIRQTGDDHIVEEPTLAETLYAAHEDIVARQHSTIPLFSTEVTPSGAPALLPYTLHGNAVVADALDVFRQTLDEKTAEKVEQGSVVRAALMRHFMVDMKDPCPSLAASVDLQGAVSLSDDTVGSAYWLPLYEALPRDNPTYRCTVKTLDGAERPIALAVECARLLGPSGATVLDRLRRSIMDNGVAAEYLDDQGGAIGNGGDAALSGLVASSVWYAVHTLGVRM